MAELLRVVLPVFLVLGAGYAAVWRGWIAETANQGLLAFAMKFAIPALLFRSVSTLDLGQVLNPWLLASYYGGGLAIFLGTLLAARLLIGRAWEDSVAIAFAALFANSVLLGLPITERAFGAEALGPNFAIVALHAPFCYGVGITAMELARAGGRPGLVALRAIAGELSRNVLLLAIAAGIAVNLSGIGLPEPVTAGIDLLARAGLPVAVFAMGGALVNFRIEGDGRAIALVVLASLVVQPALVWALAAAFGLGLGETRSAVLTAAMPPGSNAFIFAVMYGRAQRVAAASVLVGTALSVVTAWLWLSALP